LQVVDAMAKKKLSLGSLVSLSVLVKGGLRVCAGYAPQVLLKAHIHIVRQLLRRAKLTIDAHIDQHRLQRRETEDDSRSQPAGDYSEHDLSCTRKSACIF